MRVEIARSTAGDAAAIAAIAAQAFGERPSPMHLFGALRRGHNLVARGGGEPLGFAGTFITRAGSGQRRFELDLLAVAARARGNGIGGHLLQACVSAARSQHASLLRALVACDNEPMQQLCARQGLQCDGEPSLLMVTKPRWKVPCALPAGGQALRVDTLLYRGIWLEGTLQPALLQAAHAAASRERRGRIGAVIPVRDCCAERRLRRSGFALVGEYAWWQLNL